MSVSPETATAKRAPLRVDRIDGILEWDPIKAEANVEHTLNQGVEVSAFIGVYPRPIIILKVLVENGTVILMGLWRTKMNADTSDQASIQLSTYFRGDYTRPTKAEVRNYEEGR
jgi:hypothetical protein